MDNTKAAIETLKKALKLHGYTYLDVAEHLKLSEASVKKMFSTHHFTLRRIDRICEMIDMDFIDLVRLFDDQRQRIVMLSVDQERELIQDSRLFLVAICVRNHYRFDEILNAFRFSKAELFKHLARLEKLQLIELHPNNRIKLKVAENFRWIPHGPIESFFEQHLLKEFLAADFSNDKDMKIYLHGSLTLGAKESLYRRLNALSHEFSQLLKEGTSTPMSERHNVGLLLAMREWEPSMFTVMRHDD